MTAALLQDFIVEEHIKNALKEDIGFGDITTDYLVSEDAKIKAKLNTRQNGVLCGIDIFEKVFKNTPPFGSKSSLYSEGDFYRLFCDKENKQFFAWDCLFCVRFFSNK